MGGLSYKAVRSRPTVAKPGGGPNVGLVDHTPATQHFTP